MFKTRKPASVHDCPNSKLKDNSHDFEDLLGPTFRLMVEMCADCGMLRISRKRPDLYSFIGSSTVTAYFKPVGRYCGS